MRECKSPVACGSASLDCVNTGLVLDSQSDLRWASRPFVYPFHLTKEAVGLYTNVIDIIELFRMFQSVAMFALNSAVIYCVAMVAMKSPAELPSVGLALIIGAALFTAATFEVFALRHEQLGLIYVGVLGLRWLSLLRSLCFTLMKRTPFENWPGLVLVGTAIAWT